MGPAKRLEAIKRHNSRGSCCMIRKVVCAISGGVDSAVTASIIKQKGLEMGFEVSGAFMRNWDSTEEKGYCMEDNDYHDAQYVADKLDIPLIKIDFVKDYWNDVFENFVQSHRKGVTINPDVLCNKYIKFDKFFEYAQTRLKATGHYARSSFGPFMENFDTNKNCKLMIPVDLKKDQTLFLSNIPQKALRKTMFPLGDYTKPQVREMANKLGLEKISDKRESMGICFVGPRDFKHFISQYIPNSPGQIIDVDSRKPIGEHKGIHQFTIGQNLKLETTDAFYVCAMDATENIIYACNNCHHPYLYSDEVLIDDFHSIDPVDEKLAQITFKCQFRYQSQAPLEYCTVSKLTPEKFTVKFVRPARALTLGQNVTLYSDKICMGSGVISKVNRFQFDYSRIS